MRILLSNDDGIHAPGLVALEAIARQLSDDIWVVAPETDQSGLAHSLTLHDPLRVRKISDRRFAVSGTPTDCVIMAVRQLMPDLPDLVLSGVNAGANMADDVTYSGTVAVAIEATLLGIPAIALSQGYSFIPGTDLSFETAIAHGAGIITKLLEAGIRPQTLMNVNFPIGRPEDVKGVAVTRQGSYSHGLKVDARMDNRQRAYYWLTYGRAETPPKPGTDDDALRQGLISVTPLRLDMTDTDGLASLETVFGR